MRGGAQSPMHIVESAVESDVWKQPVALFNEFWKQKLKAVREAATMYPGPVTT